jgi:dihydroorotate dehydrogenase electron transfer subunit
MFIESVPVLENQEIAENVRIIRFRSRRIAPTVRAGQFLNLKPDSSWDPLLRRAYSVHQILEDDVIELIYNVHGKGSQIFAAKRPGDPIDIMGPLGIPFHIEEPFDSAILVSGGLGIAPMPILGKELAGRGIVVVNIHGSRRRAMIPQDDRLLNPRYATDDGSLGVRGNVITALEELFAARDRSSFGRLRLFACGPNVMLSALERFCANLQLPLEVSLECQMACGVGICQGCPVEMKGDYRGFTLACTYGPNYDVSTIELASLPTEHG